MGTFGSGRFGLGFFGIGEEARVEQDTEETGRHFVAHPRQRAFVAEPDNRPRPS